MGNVIELHPNPKTIGSATAAALGRLASQMLPEAQKKLNALLAAGERMSEQITELRNELRDDKIPDHARDLTNFKLTRARAQWKAIVEEAAKCMAEIDTLREADEQEPHVIRAILDALNSPSGDAA
jgi:hypothetical protein